MMKLILKPSRPGCKTSLVHMPHYYLLISVYTNNMCRHNTSNVSNNHIGIGLKRLVGCKLVSGYRCAIYIQLILLHKSCKWLTHRCVWAFGSASIWSKSHIWYQNRFIVRPICSSSIQLSLFQRYSHKSYAEQTTCKSVTFIIHLPFSSLSILFTLLLFLLYFVRRFSYPK